MKHFDRSSFHRARRFVAVPSLATWLAVAGAAAGVVAVQAGSAARAEDSPMSGDSRASSPEDGWISLFDGRTLDGWTVKCKPKDDAKRDYFWVEDGTIAAVVPPGSDHDYIWLVSRDEYADFELKLQVQTTADSTGNSGVQVRSRYDDAAYWMDGPQVDINPPGPWRTGFIYDETRGVQVWLWPDVGRPANAKPEHAPPGWKWAHAPAWNDIHIVCRGARIQTTVNGVSVADYDGAGRLDDEPHRSRNVGMKGHIALQIHPGGTLHIRFRDLRLRPIP